MKILYIVAFQYKNEKYLPGIVNDILKVSSLFNLLDQVLITDIDITLKDVLSNKTVMNDKFLSLIDNMIKYSNMNDIYSLNLENNIMYYTGHASMSMMELPCGNFIPFTSIDKNSTFILDCCDTVNDKWIVSNRPVCSLSGSKFTENIHKEEKILNIIKNATS